MPERVASLEAHFSSLTQRLDRQVLADAKVHDDLLRVIVAIQEDARERDKRDQRLIGALGLLIIVANFAGPLLAPILVRFVQTVT